MTDQRLAQLIGKPDEQRPQVAAGPLDMWGTDDTGQPTVSVAIGDGILPCVPAAALWAAIRARETVKGDMVLVVTSSTPPWAICARAKTES